MAKRAVGGLIWLGLLVGIMSTGARSDAAAPQIYPVALGFAKTSINTVIFRHSSVVTFGDIQYTAFYDGNSHVVLAKHKLGDKTWETKRTDLTGHTGDAHNTISIAADSTGIVHIAWDHHNVDLNYVQTKEPGSLEITDKLKTDGNRENSVTYPEFYNLADGDLLLAYRVGASGNGDMVLKRYHPATKAWTTLQTNLIAGEGKANAYTEMCVDSQGGIHVGWVWRGSPDVATNHNICYAHSTDGGKTWTDSKGTVLALPITAATGEIALPVPEKSSLMNQTSIAADDAGHPYICTYFTPAGQTVPQYQIIYNDGAAWHVSQVGKRTGEFYLGGGGTKQVPISRPLVLVDSKPAKPRVCVIFRDADREKRISVATTEDIAAGQWTITDVTADSYGYWEPSYDPIRWTRDQTIALFVQNTEQPNGDRVPATGGAAPSMVSILEWKP